MAERYDFDVAVVGAGSAGYAAARTAAGAGLKTVIIEGGKEVGGLCILRGCMPTKALLYAAEVMRLAGHPDPWGIRVGKVRFNFQKVMARKNALIQDFAGYRVRQLTSGPFKFIRATARFVDAHTLELTPERRLPAGALPRRQSTTLPAESRCSRLLTAAHFIIATGSEVAPPPLPSLHQVGYITSDDALVLKRLPKSLIILGGGPTACEFTQFFARFGVKVTLVQRSPHVLHDFDPEAAAVVETVFRREGIKVFTGTKLLEARRTKALKTIRFEHQGRAVSVSAEEILFALGRVPNTDSLGLENAGVITDRGRIVANDRMQTSAPHIYTGGDCTGPYEIVHIAVQQGEIAARNIVTNRLRHGSDPLDETRIDGQSRDLHSRSLQNLARLDDRVLVVVVFTEPQVAFVGLTEKKAKARGIPYIAASYPFNDHGKSLIMEAKDGFVKLLADPQSGEILGGACVGPVGGELIHEIAAAMAKRMTVHELAAMPHYHPTLAEIWTYPAEELAEKVSAH